MYEDLTKEPVEREAVRFPFRAYVRYDLIHGEMEARKKHEGWCQDISNKGMELVVSEPLHASDEIKLLLYLEGEPKPMTVFCRVVWCETLKENRYSVGLEFRKVSDYLKFMRTLCKKVGSALIGE